MAEPAQPSADFRTTHWTVVRLAGDGQADSARRAEALAALCRDYWYPLYTFVRRQGRTPQEAEDTTQEFFAHLLSKDGFANVHPGRGRFRSFLLASLRNFLVNEWHRDHAVKRGGQHRILSWDQASMEQRFALEPQDAASPESLYEKAWAMSVLQAAIRKLEDEYVRQGKARLFGVLQSHLAGEGCSTYTEIGKSLDLTEGAVKMAVLRLRAAFREHLRSEVARTVGSTDEVDEEVRHLFACLAR